MKTSISSGVILSSTFIGIALVSLPRDSSDILFVGICLTITLITKKSLQPLEIFLKFFIPFVIPLFLIHTVLNPIFPSEHYLFNFLPFKPKGLDFSARIVQQISILLAVSTMWFFVCRDRFLDWLISRKFPLLVYATFAQAIAIISLIERRGAIVYKAQQARGLQTGPGLLQRLKALPSVMLPVIATVINETEWRAIALLSRGFYSTEMTAPNVSMFDRDDPLKVIALGTPLLIKVALWIL